MAQGCPWLGHLMSPLRVTAPGLGPTMCPQGWNGVSLSPSCNTKRTAGQILLEHLPSCDTCVSPGPPVCHPAGQGPYARCISMARVGAGALLHSQGGPSKPSKMPPDPLRTSKTPTFLQAPSRALMPQAGAHPTCLHPRDAPGCQQPPQSWLRSGVQLRGAGYKEALTPLKLDLQHVWGVGRGGRIAGLRVEPRGGRILPMGWRKEEKVSGVGNTNPSVHPPHILHPQYVLATPRTHPASPVRIAHHQYVSSIPSTQSCIPDTHPPSPVHILHPQYVSSIPSTLPPSPVHSPASPVCIPHPKAWGRQGTAPALTGALGTKGLGGISQFFPST